MLVAALRRFLILLAVACGVTVAVSVLLALAADAALLRAVSLGLYLMGSFLLIAGFFVGNRTALRTAANPDPGRLGVLNRRIRTATGEERSEAIATSGLLLALGVALLVLGVLADTRHDLV